MLQRCQRNKYDRDDRRSWAWCSGKALRPPSVNTPGGQLRDKDDSENRSVRSLCGFDNVPRAVVVHVAFAARILVVAMVVMTLGFDFLEREGEEKPPLALRTN